MRMVCCDESNMQNYEQIKRRLSNARSTHQLNKYEQLHKLLL